MSAYAIVDVAVKDADKYEEYRKAVVPTVDKFGGKFVVRGGKFEVTEGQWTPNRLVVVEFPDMAKLKAWYNSADYAQAKALRQSAADANFVIVEGT